MRLGTVSRREIELVGFLYTEGGGETLEIRTDVYWAVGNGIWVPQHVCGGEGDGREGRPAEGVQAGAWRWKDAVNDIVSLFVG